MMIRKGKANRITRLLENHHEETLRKADHLKEILIHLQYEGKPSLGKNLRKAGEILEFFQGEVNKHMEEEERILFPFLETHLPRLESLISLLRSEHQNFKRHASCFNFLLDRLEGEKDELEREKLIEKLRETGMYLVYLLQGHLQEESEILYRAAEQQLKSDEKKKLAKQLCLTSGQRR